MAIVVYRLHERRIPGIGDGQSWGRARARTARNYNAPGGTGVGDGPTGGRGRHRRRGRDWLLHRLPPSSARAARHRGGGARHHWRRLHQQGGRYSEPLSLKGRRPDARQRELHGVNSRNGKDHTLRVTGDAQRRSRRTAKNAARRDRPVGLWSLTVPCAIASQRFIVAIQLLSIHMAIAVGRSRPRYCQMMPPGRAVGIRRGGGLFLQHTLSICCPRHDLDRCPRCHGE